MILNRRKLAAVMVLAAMILSGIGCSENKKENDTQPKSETITEEIQNSEEIVVQEKAEIRIFQYKVEIEESLLAACELYMNEHPDVRIQIETIGGSESYEDALKEKMESGQQIDIFNIQGPEDCLNYKDNLENLEDQPWVENAAKGVLEDVTVEKEIYGLPYGLEGYGLVYNKAIFEAAGISALDLTNYEVISKAFGTLQYRIVKGELKEQFPNLTAVTELAGGETWVTGTHLGNAVLSNEFKDTMDAFHSPTVEFRYADQYQKQIDLQADYSRYKDKKYLINTVTYQDQLNALALEEVAVIQQGNWISNEIAQINPEVAGNLAILPLSLYNVNENCIPVGVPRYWCVNKQSSDVNKAAAKDFLNWLYQSEEGKSIIVNDFGFIPAFLNYEDYPVTDVLAKAVMQYVNAGQVTKWISSGLPSGWSEKSLGNNIKEYLSGKMTWGKVMETAKKDWETARVQ